MNAQNNMSNAQITQWGWPYTFWNNLPHGHEPRESSDMLLGSDHIVVGREGGLLGDEERGGG